MDPKNKQYEDDPVDIYETEKWLQEEDDKYYGDFEKEKEDKNGRFSK